MMNDPFIIGITGVAGSGKDTAALFLEQNLSLFDLRCKRFSLAESLKEQCKSFCVTKWGIDPTNCTREDKEKIREYLVAFGKRKRIKSEGQFWLNIISDKIKKSNCDVAIITDIRYCEYKNDEMQFIQNNDGLLLHIARKGIDGNLLQPPNADEAKNDPILEENSDYSITLNTLMRNDDIDNLLFNFKEMNKMLYFCLKNIL